MLKIDIETSEKYLFDGDYRSWLTITKYFLQNRMTLFLSRILQLES